MDLSHARRIVAARPRGDWQLHTDGGVTGDGGGASGGGASGGGGVVISLGPPSEGRVLAEVAIYWPPECRVTVPEAELIAVLVAVRMAAVLGIAAFSSFGDAAAVFGALNGEMEVQAASSHALMRVAVAMLRCFPRRFRFVHVPRAENAAADALTHVARERRMSLAALRTTPFDSVQQRLGSLSAVDHLRLFRRWGDRVTGCAAHGLLSRPRRHLPRHRPRLRPGLRP